MVIRRKAKNLYKLLKKVVIYFKLNIDKQKLVYKFTELIYLSNQISLQSVLYIGLSSLIF